MVNFQTKLKHMVCRNYTHDMINHDDITENDVHIYSNRTNLLELFENKRFVR